MINELDPDKMPLTTTIGDMGIYPRYYDAKAQVAIKADIDVVQDLRNVSDEQKQKIDNLESMAISHDSKINYHDTEIHNIKETLSNIVDKIVTPNVIANQALDKLQEFITTNTRVLTDKQGLTTKMVEVSRLEGAIHKIKEVLNNGAPKQ
jgi:hypothetical protein